MMNLPAPGILGKAFGRISISGFFAGLGVTVDGVLGGASLLIGLLAAFWAARASRLAVKGKRLEIEERTIAIEKESLERDAARLQLDRMRDEEAE